MSSSSAWFDELVAEARRTDDGKSFGAAGFELAHTGGGCTAWRLDLGECFILITDSGGTDHRLGDGYAADPARADCWLIGLHLNDGEYSDGDEAATAVEAIAVARRIVDLARQSGSSRS